MVAKLEDAGVVLQHGGDLHLNRVPQLLPLSGDESGAVRREQAGTPRRTGARLTWLSIFSSTRVALLAMALMMAFMPSAVMKFDSMLRLCRLVFSCSISAHACSTHTHTHTESGV